MVAFDEMTGSGAELRPAYAALDRWLKEAPPEMLALEYSCGEVAAEGVVARYQAAKRKMLRPIGRIRPLRPPTKTSMAAGGVVMSR